MKKHGIVLQLLVEIIFSLFLSGGLYFYLQRTNAGESKIFLEATLITSGKGTCELFYSKDSIFDQKHSMALPVEQIWGYQTIRFQMPYDSIVSKFRFDFDNKKGIAILNNISLYTGSQRITWSGNKLMQSFRANKSITEVRLVDGNVEYLVAEEDPFIILNNDISKEYKGLMNSSLSQQYKKSIVLSFILFFIILTCLRILGVSEKILLTVANPDKFLLILFVIILFLPLFNMIFSAFPEPRNYEKRQLNEKPLYDISRFDEYTDRYTKYFNDHFGFRTVFIKLNGYFKYYILGSSPSSKALLGKDEWLFFPENLDPISDVQLKLIESNIEEISLRLKSKGIDYYLVIVPEKSYVYPDKFPEHYKKVDLFLRTNQVINYLKQNKNIKIIDLREVLNQGKKTRELYYPSDTHWNMYGSMLAYNHVIAEIGKDHPDVITRPLSDYNFVEVKRNGGDMSFVFEAPEIFPMRDWIPVLDGKPLYSTGYLDSILVRKNTEQNPLCKNGKKVVLLHDSFGLYWRKQLKEDFNESTFYWTNYFDNELIEEKKPDIVVHEMVNRFVLNLRNP